MKFSSLISLFLIGLLVILLCIISLGIFWRGPVRVPVTKAKMEILHLNMALTRYASLYRTYPAGDQAAIVKQLLNDNPRKISFITINPASINKAGEYVDPWGTPYTISFPSTNTVIISSAGRDKAFKSPDDLLFNSLTNGFVKP